MNDKEGHILNIFGTLTDYRMQAKCDYKLIDIIVLSICAVISGADNWVAVQDFGIAKEKWLRKFLELPNGIPSHDTISRTFRWLNTLEFEACFLKWVQSVSEIIECQIIPIDGKTLRRSYDKKSDKAAIHMVSAWGAMNGLVLGQIKTKEKSNEITAIPELLNLLDINGCIITIDAMGCQKAITKKIIDKGADYVIAVKENQPTLYRDIITHIDESLEKSQTNKNIIDYHETSESGHGRKEIRRYYIVDNVNEIESAIDWEGLNTIGMVESIRTENKKTTTNKRYYISSINKNAKHFSNAVRKHWGIENSLHWVLDVAFREDESRVRKDNSAENFSVLRRIALNCLKSEKTAKGGIKNKRNKAGWDLNYLEKVVGF